MRRHDGPGDELFALPCLCGNLRRLARLMTRLYDEELRTTGIETSQFGILAALNARGELTQGRLSAGFAIDGTTLTRTLGHLRRNGWVTSRPGTDRRSRVFTITPEGRAVFLRARPRWQRAQQRVMRATGSKTWSALTEQSQTVAATLLHAAPATYGPQRHKGTEKKKSRNPDIS